MTAEQSGAQARLTGPEADPETPDREQRGTRPHTDPDQKQERVPEELEAEEGPQELVQPPWEASSPPPVLADRQLWRSERGPGPARSRAPDPIRSSASTPGRTVAPETEDALQHHETPASPLPLEGTPAGGDGTGLEDEEELTHTHDESKIIVAGDTGEDDALLQQVLSELSTNISILGSGGAGNNTVHRLLAMGIEGSTVIALNTDAQHLLSTHTHRKILLGRNLTKGLGAGSLPRIGEGAAEESRQLVSKAIAGSDIVFLTCGLGGGTGTGSLPILTSVAREIGALTIAIVTLPFKSEGAIRMANAVQGLTKLREVADTVIVIPNDRLLEVAPLMPLNQAFRMADEILGRAIKCMTDITTKPGLINIDFADLRTIMRSGGVAMVGTGESSAENRAVRAVEEALSSPLLQVDITGAQGALVNVTGGADMTLQEAEQVLKVVQQKINKEARIIWGASVDESLEQKLRVMLVVTGVHSPQILGPTSKTEQEMENRFGIDFVQ